MMPGGKYQTMLHNGQMGATQINPDGSVTGTIHLDNDRWDEAPAHQATYPSLPEAQKDIETRLRSPRLLSQNEIADRGLNGNGQSQRINEHNHAVLNPQKINGLDNQFFDNLDHTALKSPTPNDMTLYRGVNTLQPGADRFEDLRPGESIGGTKPLFSSASERPEVAHAFATEGGRHNHGVIMQIHTPKGFPTLKMPDYDNEDYERPHNAEGYYPLGLEKERLFPRGTAFQVNHKEKGRSMYDGRPLTVLHVTPSHPSFDQAPKLARSTLGKSMSKDSSIADMLSAATARNVIARDGWEYDAKLDAFKTADLNKKFACNCGRNVKTQDMARCACGVTWNSCVIGSNDKTAGKSTKIVRTVPEHRERILAHKFAKNKPSGWVRQALESAGLPSFVRSADITNGSDAAPTPLTDSLEPRGEASPERNMINPMGTPPRQTEAAGGWGRSKAPSAPAGNYTPPKPVTPPPAQDFSKPAVSTTPKPTNFGLPTKTVPKPAPAPAQAPPKTPYVNPQQNQNSPAALPVTPPTNGFGLPQTNPAAANLQNPYANPALQQSQFPTQPVAQQPTNWGLPTSPPQRTYNMFSEDEYTKGYKFANADLPLPESTLHVSFIEGYRDRYREIVSAYVEGDKAPGWAELDGIFEEPNPKVNNSMSDYTDDTPKDLAAQVKELRNDFKTKIDSDNAKGQSRSNDSLTDLTGWKTSALLKEIARRTNDEI